MKNRVMFHPFFHNKAKILFYNYKIFISILCKQIMEPNNVSANKLFVIRSKRYFKIFKYDDYILFNSKHSSITAYKPQWFTINPPLLAGMQVQAHLLTPLTAADSNLKYNIPCILASWRHFRSCQPARVKLYTVHNWSGWRVTFVLVIIKPAQSVGFWRIKKKPYQAPPTQLGPRKCTF